MMEAMEPDPVTIIGVAVAEALAVLAKMLHSFHEAGVEAEVDPYAVIADIPSGEPEGEAKSDEEDVGVV